MSDHVDAKAGRQETILILEYDGQGEDQKADILTEARNIRTKLLGKGREVTLHETKQAFQTWMTGADSRHVAKIHIVAHGNQETCGNYNAGSLADFIRTYVVDKQDLKFITIHSCCAGEPHPDTEAIFIQQFAARLLTHLKGGSSQYIVVRGSDGESYTDSVGRNWVLKDGIKRIRYHDRKGEKQWLKANTKPRASARPRFAITNLPTYRGVD